MFDASQLGPDLGPVRFLIGLPEYDGNTKILLIVKYYVCILGMYVHTFAHGHTYP